VNREQIKPSRFGLIIIVNLIVICFLIGLYWHNTHANEPVYCGKRLTYWLDQYADYYEAGPGCAQRDEAESAIRRIGTNALPCLLALIVRKDSLLNRALPQAASQWLNVRRATYYETLGAYGFLALGEGSKAAVPKLIMIADSPDPEIRYRAIVALGGLGCEQHQIVPVLVKHLNDPRVAPEAAQDLGLIHEEPAIAIPALLHNIGPSPSGFDNSYFAIKGLAGFGKEAQTAVPVLLKLLQEHRQDANPSLCSTITNALKAIQDP
jgi:hypothetical protein